MPLIIDTNALQHHIPMLMAQHHVPGLSLAAIKDGEIAFTETFGVIRTNSAEPITPNTLFEAASLTKPLFAAAVLRLCQTGQLDLDTPLSSYLPNPYIENEPRLHHITARHVLSHTTGFPNWRAEGKPLAIHFTPGKRFSYSGEGYMYLQAVVTHLVDMPVTEWMQATMLEPLGMQHSQLTWSADDPVTTAIGHDTEGKPQPRRDWPTMMAAASLHCTAADYARFICSMLRPSAEAAPLIDAMLTPQIAVNDSLPWKSDWPKETITLNEQVSWGLGWGLQHTADGDAFWHWGDNWCYRSFTLGERASGNGLVIMTNAVGGQTVINHILRDIIGGNYPSIDWLYGPTA